MRACVRACIQTLRTKFDAINAALECFVAEMKAQGVWDDMAIVSLSDFGRTLTSNGLGTDHAWGGNHFVLGGGVQGGQIFGQYPTALMDDSDLNIGRGRILPTTSWEALWQPLAEWLGVDSAHMPRVLPNARNFAPPQLISKQALFGGAGSVPSSMMRRVERSETDGVHGDAEGTGGTDGTFPLIIVIGVTVPVAALVAVGIIIVQRMTKRPAHNQAAARFDFIRELQQCESKASGGGYAPDLSASHSSFVSFASTRFLLDQSSNQHLFASMRLGLAPSSIQNSLPDDSRSYLESLEPAPDDSLSSSAVVV